MASFSSKIGRLAFTEVFTIVNISNRQCFSISIQLILNMNITHDKKTSNSSRISLACMASFLAFGAMTSVSHAGVMLPPAIPPAHQSSAESLAFSAVAPGLLLDNASLVINGAHGHPMRYRLAAGKQSVWVSGDLGRTYQGEDGNVRAGEIGYAYGLNSDVTVKFALGRTYGKVDTFLGGNTRIQGTYFVPEVIAKMSGTPLYVSFAGYYNDGSADMKRGFDNAGAREFSEGSADTKTSALRIRLDWVDAAKYGKTSFTPYTSVTYYKGRVDGYAETGGSSPARWDSRTEHATEARLGLDAVHRLDEKMNLLARIEGVHRFSESGTNLTGTDTVMGAFNLPGQEYERNWLRAAVGLEGKLGVGTGYLMLNASSQDDAARYWLAANYKIDF